MTTSLYPPMALDDPRISHLEILGENREESIRNLKKRLGIEGLGFLDLAEITDSHVNRDGGLANKYIAYVGGISGRRDEPEQWDPSDDIYSILTFYSIQQSKRGVWTLWDDQLIQTNRLKHIVDYRKLI